MKARIFISNQNKQLRQIIISLLEIQEEMKKKLLLTMIQIDHLRKLVLFDKNPPNSSPLRLQEAMQQDQEEHHHLGEMKKNQVLIISKINKNSWRQSSSL